MREFEKVIALYEYTKRLAELKYSVVSDINKQLFSLPIKAIPEYEHYTSVSFRDSAEADGDLAFDAAPSPLLRVQKPDFQPCPKPAEFLLPRLKAGWDNYKNSGEHLFQREIKEEFSTDPDRVTAYKKWITERNEWVKRQLKIESVRGLFMSLFNVYTDLNRESETQELMVGGGTLKVAGDSRINHPVLLKRVSIKLDAKENIIKIFDSEGAPEIYTLLLSYVTDLNHSAIKSAQEELAQGFFHPLDRNNASDFVKTFTHRLSSDSDFVEYGAESKKIASGIQVSMDEPVFFVRKKIDGTLKVLETIIETIRSTHEYPLPLGELVSGGMIEIPEAAGEPTIEERLAYANGENPEILLSKPANREQLEIAERIERCNAVFVQGPPGTGKTHTIANLIGHFLAQGKSVLVTSYTAKALSVVQEKLPGAIQNLCVTVSGDDNSSMVRSADGISEFMTEHTSNEMKQRAESAQAKREAILKRLNSVRKQLYQIRYSEFKPIVFDGEEYSPKEAAEFVRRHSDELSYIPGKVKLYRALPVTLDDLVFVYKYNGDISREEEAELAASLPNPAALPSVSDFQNLCDNFNAARSETVKPSNAPEITGTPDSSKVDYIIDAYIKPLQGVYSWAAFAAADGKRGGGYRQMWEKLCSLVIKASDYSRQNINLLLDENIQLSNSVTITMICNNREKLNTLYAKGKPSVLSLMFSKEVKTIVNGVKINGQRLAASLDCHILTVFAELEQMRAEITPLWNELLGKKGVPDFRSLGDEPENIAARFVKDIKVYLDWDKTVLGPFKSDIEGTGLSFEAVFPLDHITDEQERFVVLFSAIVSKLPKLLRSVKDWAAFNDAIEEKKRLLSESTAKQSIIQNGLSETGVNNSPVCGQLRQAVTALDVSLYSERYSLLCELYKKRGAINRRREILDRIKSAAPFWAEAIESRQGIHGGSVCPDNISDAWKRKQFAGIIDELTEQPFEALQRENAVLSVKLREVTTDLVTDKAWFHLLRTTEADLSMRQALQGWKMTVSRIGKGTGKNAPMYRRQAMEQMSICQRAVPAWIMPINKAMDTLNPAINKFDVVIIDEASQCDLSSIGILYMAKKIIIVGDDKQVSPMAIGIDVGQTNVLRNIYIKDIIPNWHLYEPKTSLYDVAKTTFQPLTLREHFRCLPEIIGYSNKLSYDYKIKPLRDAGTARLSPSVVNYRVANGTRDARRKINKEEAASVAAIIRACVEQPEYAEMTFGVISLLGDEQAVLIQKLILEQIPARIIEERRILCGNAAHFQGDERDIILLSLVDSNEGDGQLRLTGTDTSTKQRYNVAASRAKEQLWVVHSLDHTRDLKNGDMRRDLIEYANDTSSFLQVADAAEERLESPFEEIVGKSLVSAGYSLKRRYPAGTYRLDMVVSGGGKKAVLECDGDAWHSGELQIHSDMERQTILERAGWRFVRIRGSEYYRNPEKAMARVMNDLAGLGIMPESKVNEQTEETASDLLERVKTRVNQIMDDSIWC
jgi:very-short-patch-repair endonuclease